MINLTISGRVGADAKELETGCVFNLATTEKGYTNKEGVVIADKTTWFSVFARKGLAPHIKKSDCVIIHTKSIDTSIYEDKVSLTVRAEEFEFGGK